MSPSPGDLYLIDLGMVGKVRPAVVVSRYDPDRPRAVSIFAPLTTQSRGSAYEVAIGKLKFLTRESWINVEGLVSIGDESLLRRLGRIQPGQFTRVKAAVRWASDL